MNLDPDSNLGFLVSDIARLLREQFNTIAQAIGLTLAQARALVQLARNEGISQVALARILEIQPITLMRQIDKLEQAGLLERRPDPTDRRAQQLYLTDAAQPYLEQITAVGATLNRSACAGMSEQARDQMITRLQQVRQNLSSAGTEVPAATPPANAGGDR